MKRKTEPAAIVDASAVLAYLHRERGYEVIRPILHQAAMSTVNFEEVLIKMHRKGVDPLLLSTELKKRGIRLFPYTEDDVLQSLHIDSAVEKRGMLPIYTADQLWNRLKLGARIRPIR